MPRLSLADPNKWTELAATSSSRFRYDNYKIWYRCFRTCCLKYIYLPTRARRKINFATAAAHLSRPRPYFLSEEIPTLSTCFHDARPFFSFNKRTNRNRVACMSARCPLLGTKSDEIFIVSEVFEVGSPTNRTYIIPNANYDKPRQVKNGERPS